MRRIFIILCIFLAGFLCGGLGFLAGFTHGYPIGANPPVEWVALGKPPVPAEHLLSATPYAVYVETNDGQVFAGDANCLSNPCWSATVDWTDSPGWTDQYLTVSAACKFEDSEDIKEIPGQLLECASLKYVLMPDGYVTAYYVLLEDGSVWVWKYGRYNLDKWIGLGTGIQYGLLGCGVSLIFYLFVIFMTVLLVFLRRQSS